MALTEKRLWKTAQRGTPGAGSVLRKNRPVPLRSCPGGPGRALPLQRTRATARAVSRVEPWDFAVSPLNFSGVRRFVLPRNIRCHFVGRDDPGAPFFGRRCRGGYYPPVRFRRCPAGGWYPPLHEAL